MLTGLDCFSTQVVALRHKGRMRAEVKTLAEILREAGYNTTCVGFQGNPASRGFDKYLNFAGWGSWDEGRSPRPRTSTRSPLPELDRLAAEDKPFFLFLRHMDPHAPYLPPAPFERMFYHGNECDPDNQSMEPVMAFKPFCDFFASWMPPGITDKDYVIAQYDGEVAYMDACIQAHLHRSSRRWACSTTRIVVINSDHGETLYDHECCFDHHGMYDHTLHVPLIIRYPARCRRACASAGTTSTRTWCPRCWSWPEIETRSASSTAEPDADGARRGRVATRASSTSPSAPGCASTAGARREWKLIVALEPDFHFKPPVELYNLVEDPGENVQPGRERARRGGPAEGRMEAWIAKRETGDRPAQPDAHPGRLARPRGRRALQVLQQAYDTLHIGDPGRRRSCRRSRGNDRSVPGFHTRRFSHACQPAIC